MIFKKKDEIVKTKIFEHGFKSWLSFTTCHGYPRVLVHKSTFFKVLWVIFPTIMAGLAFFLITKSLRCYLDFKVVTNINTYDKNNALFPTISICNQNPFVTNFSVNYVQELL